MRPVLLTCGHAAVKGLAQVHTIEAGEWEATSRRGAARVAGARWLAERKVATGRSRVGLMAVVLVLVLVLVWLGVLIVDAGVVAVLEVRVHVARVHADVAAIGAVARVAIVAGHHQHVGIVLVMLSAV